MLPRSQSIELQVAINAILSTIQELLRQLKSANEHQPRVPAVALANVAALLLKPFTLGVDKLEALGRSCLVAVLDEVVAQAVTFHGLLGKGEATVEG